MKPGTLPLAFVLISTFVLNAAAVTRYVDLNSPSPTPPYTNWLTAATNIQDAVDVAAAGETVLVTNGVYATGGRVVYGVLTNRVAVSKAVSLRSVNGPTVTEIRGHQIPASTNGFGAVRGVYLTNGAFLSGFTVSGGATSNAGDGFQTDGGGIWCASRNVVVSNCVVTGNAAHTHGAGVFQGSLVDCLVVSNCIPADNWWGTGGGLYGSYAINTTLMGNFAWYAGGAYGATMEVCLIAGNSAWDVGGGAEYCELSHCIVIGNVANGAGGRLRVP